MKKWVCMLLMLALALPTSASAAVAVNGLCAALIGEDGRVIVEPGRYAEIFAVAEGLFAAGNGNGSYCLLDAEGSPVTEDGYTFFDAAEDEILFEKDGKYGVMNAALQVIVPAEYTWIVPNGKGGYLTLRSDIWDDFPDGVYRVDKSGHATPTGVKIASLINPLNFGLSPALSTDKGRYGYLNAQGQWEIQPQFIYADAFSADGTAMAVLDSGSGLIDTAGAWKITPRYDYIMRFGEKKDKIAAVNYGRGIDVYNAAGKLLFSCKAQSEGTYFMVSGCYLVAFEADSTRIIDETGKLFLQVPAQTTVEAAGKYLILREGRWGENNVWLVSPEGMPGEERYQDLQMIAERDGEPLFLTRRFERGEEGDWDVSGMRCGLIDGEENELLPMEYSDIEGLPGGWLLAEKDGIVELYSPQGVMVWTHKL